MINYSVVFYEYFLLLHQIIYPKNASNILIKYQMSGQTNRKFKPM